MTTTLHTEEPNGESHVGPPAPGIRLDRADQDTDRTHPGVCHRWRRLRPAGFRRNWATPYIADSCGLAVVERSIHRLVVEELNGEGGYEFAHTVKGTREGYADKQVVRDPSPDAEPETGVAGDD